MEKFNWNASNGLATAEETQRAYWAITHKGPVSDFSMNVWKDIVNKVREIQLRDGLDWLYDENSSGYDRTFDECLLGAFRPGRNSITMTRFGLMPWRINYTRLDLQEFWCAFRWTYHNIACTSILLEDNPNPALQGSAYSLLYGRYFLQLVDAINHRIDTQTVKIQHHNDIHGHSDLHALLTPDIVFPFSVRNSIVSSAKLSGAIANSSLFSSRVNISSGSVLALKDDAVRPILIDDAVRTARLIKLQPNKSLPATFRSNILASGQQAIWVGTGLAITVQTASRTIGNQTVISPSIGAVTHRAAYRTSFCGQVYSGTGAQINHSGRAVSSGVHTIANAPLSGLAIRPEALRSSMFATAEKLAGSAIAGRATAVVSSGVFSLRRADNPCAVLANAAVCVNQDATAGAAMPIVSSAVFDAQITSEAKFSAPCSSVARASHSSNSESYADALARVVSPATAQQTIDVSTEAAAQTQPLMYPSADTFILQGGTARAEAHGVEAALAQADTSVGSVAGVEVNQHIIPIPSADYSAVVCVVDAIASKTRTSKATAEANFHVDNLAVAVSAYTNAPVAECTVQHESFAMLALTRRGAVLASNLDDTLASDLGEKLVNAIEINSELEV